MVTIMVGSRALKAVFISGRRHMAHSDSSLLSW